MALTSVQDAIIDRLEAPAAWIEGATGRSFQYVTAALYATSLLLPAESVLLFGGKPVGLALLPAFVGFVLWRLRDALALASRGVSRGPARTLSPDRSSIPIVAVRMMWTAVTVVSVASSGLALAVGLHPRGLFLQPLAVALLLALHLHACSPPAAPPRRVVAARA